MRWINFLFIVCFALSCSKNNPIKPVLGDGTAVIDCLLSNEETAKVTRITETTRAHVWIYNSIGSLVTDKELTMNGKRATGTVKIKSGIGYKIDLNGFDRFDFVTYYGSTSNVTIEAGKTTNVQITLYKETLEKILFASDRDGNLLIYVMDEDGSNQTRLTNNSYGDYTTFWSPDGSQIVFNSDRDGNNEIYVMDADGSNQTNLTNNPAGDHFPSWSPF